MTTEQAFINGLVWAAARIVEMYDEPTIAASIVRESSASLEQLQSAAEYDIAFLRGEMPYLRKGVE